MMKPFRATKKPITIDAINCLEDEVDAVLLFLDSVEKWIVNEGVIIKTLEGDMTASWGDIIIKGINGEFYPCKPDIFAKSYNVNID